MKKDIHFQDHPAVEVTTGKHRFLVAPQEGARLLRWEIDGEEVIHWPDVADWGRVAGVRGGNPILFPFPARHMVDGVIGFWLDQNGTKRALPMHGFARDLPFEVVPEKDECTVRMRLTDTPQTREMYPFSFQFDVIYTLSDGGLSVAFETTNTGSERLPYYAGHHFYFAAAHQDRADWTLQLPVQKWGRQKPDGSIVFEKAEKELNTLNEASLIDRMNVAAAYDRVVLQNASTGRTMTMDLAPRQNETPWYVVVTWTEKPESDFFCVEPWLGLPNAIHHGQGLRWVEPNQTERAVCRLTAAGYGKNRS